MESELNNELSQLQYRFGRTEGHFSLAIGASREIHFPHGAGGRVAGGSAAWIAKKHADGAIHEPGMVAALVCLSRQCKNRPTAFFDIGGLYGYFALVAKALLPQASVHAFEMNPDSFKALISNFRANHHLGDPLPQGVNVGLSDRTEHQHKSKVTGFVLDEYSTDADGVPLDLLRLDDFCARAGVRPDIIKMDVEGYQAKILPGAMETIAASMPAILLEFDHPETLARFATTNAAVVRPLFDLGYRLFWCRHQRGRGARFDHIQATDMSEHQEHNSLGLFIAP